ncbi:hypothetical protein GGR52DRAFT_560937, partial [Hypoxylon sp. FL1284]
MSPPPPPPSYSQVRYTVSFDITENPDPSFDLAWRRSKSVDTTACLDLARLTAEWLKICCTSHRCEDQRDPSFYPTRLLELFDDTARLIDTKDLTGLASPYATLSYSWGRESFLRL